MISAVWKTIAIGLAVALVAALAGVGVVGFKLYAVTIQLSDCKESKALIEGSLNLQSEKVSSLGRDTKAAQTRFNESQKKLSAMEDRYKTVTEFAATITGPACADAMPVINKVIEATR